MTCANLEILLCDYADGTLSAGERTTLEAHIANCKACAELAADVLGALEFIGSVPAADPPAQLVSNILRQVPVRRPWWKKVWSAPVIALLEPRLALGLAMTILSLSMLVKLGHIEQRDISHGNLAPMKFWHILDDSTYRAWDRTIEAYDNMPLVMDLESRWQEWQGQNQGSGDGEVHQEDQRR